MTLVLGLLTLAGSVAGILVLGSRGRVAIHSLFHVFVLVWLAYGLTVPLDLLFGFVVPAAAADRLPDLNQIAMRPVVTVILLHYIACGVAFAIMYWLSGRPVRSPVYRRYAWSLPSVATVIVLAVVVLTIYVGAYWPYTRQARVVLGRDDLIVKLLTLTTTAFFALVVAYIAASSDRRRSLVVMALGMTVGAAVGGRFQILLFPLLYAMRHQVSFRLSKALPAAAACWLLVVYWKVAYGALLYTYTTGAPLSLTSLPTVAGISGLEPATSFRIFAKFLTEADSPLWMGSSYSLRVASVSLPRFLFETPTLTLAEEYGLRFHPSKIAKGGGLGFSALAESWLNFGVFGPLLLGGALGFVAKKFDGSRRGIAYFIMVVVFVRLFRSDAATLVKSWFVLLGGAAACVALAMNAPRFFGTPHPPGVGASPRLTARSSRIAPSGLEMADPLANSTASSGGTTVRRGDRRGGWLRRQEFRTTGRIVVDG